jgi:hypothetical protein
VGETFGEGRARMESVSRWALASLASPPLAGLRYLLGRLEADRLVAAGEGWEMAFYWSPLVFLAIDSVLVLGAIAGLVGLAVGPGAPRRAQAAIAVLACVVSFLALPWR